MKNKAYIQAQLGFVIKNLQLLQEKHVKMQLTIVGTSDCSGLSSNDYSQQRAKTVKNTVLEKLTGFKNIVTDVKVCKTGNHPKNLSLLGVKFNLKEH
jgi:histidinol phosphatase-like enzyme